jgi:hypothetical protein
VPSIELYLQFLGGRCATLKEKYDDLCGVCSGMLVHDAVLKAVAFKSLGHDRQFLRVGNSGEMAHSCSLPLGVGRKRGCLFQASVRRERPDDVLFILLHPELGKLRPLHNVAGKSRLKRVAAARLSNASCGGNGQASSLIGAGLHVAFVDDAAFRFGRLAMMRLASQLKPYAGAAVDNLACSHQRWRRSWPLERTNHHHRRARFGGLFQCCRSTDVP